MNAQENGRLNEGWKLTEEPNRPPLLAFADPGIFHLHFNRVASLRLTTPLCSETNSGRSGRSVVRGDKLRNITYHWRMVFLSPAQPIAGGRHLTSLHWPHQPYSQLPHVSRLSTLISSAIYTHHNRSAHPGWLRTATLPPSSPFSCASTHPTLWSITPHLRQLVGLQHLSSRTLTL